MLDKQKIISQAQNKLTMHSINNKYEIIISKQMKNTEMDESTKDWFMKYDHKEIIKPDKFFPDPQFIEYHNDVIFQR